MYTYSYTMNKQELDEAIFNWEWPNALEWTEDELLFDYSISATGIYRGDADTDTGSNDCAHDWVNISFSNLHFACKHCGIDKCE
jgi:hypothetical protein